MLLFLDEKGNELYPGMEINAKKQWVSLKKKWGLFIEMKCYLFSSEIGYLLSNILERRIRG